MNELFTQIIEQVRGVWRFRWRALVLAWLVAVFGWTYVYTIPDFYRVDTRVAIDTESALRELMEGRVVSTNVMSEVELMSQALLSRPRLEAVTRETDLDLRASTPRQYESLLDSLRRNIRLTRERSNSGNAIFNLSFTDTDPRMTYEVVSKLLESFVSETVDVDRRGREEALEFLEQQLSVYEQELNDAENALAEFQRANVGRVPGEEGDYYARLEGAISLQNRLDAALRVARDKRNLLQQRIAGEEAVFGIAPGPSSSVATSVDAQVVDVEQQLQDLQLRFTEKHPDVLAAQARLEQLYARQDEERAVAAGALPDTGDTDLALNPVYQEMRIQLTTAELDVASLEAQLRQQQATVTGLREAVDTLPVVEAEYKRLTRDLSTIRANYEDYKQRVEAARTTLILESRGDDVQFRVLEPPKSPITPDGPNRVLLLTVVLMGALGAGAGLAFVYHQLNPIFSNRNSLSTITELPVIGSVSLIETPAERFRLHTQTALYGVGLATLVIAWVGSVMFNEKGVALASRLMAGAGL
ncbi:MAG: XrtA system polysaccharide chain length determinant [Pseudomonadota bacterium]